MAEWDELQETIAVLSDPPSRADLTEAEEAAQHGETKASMPSRSGPSAIARTPTVRS